MSLLSSTARADALIDPRHPFAAHLRRAAGLLVERPHQIGRAHV